MAVSTDDELTQLRAARRQELQSQIEEQANAQLAAEEQAQISEAEEGRLNEAMKIILTPDARSRLARLELAFPELSQSVKEQLFQLHSSKRIATPIADSTLKTILSGLQEQRRDPSIRRV